MSNHCGTYLLPRLHELGYGPRSENRSFVDASQGAGYDLSAGFLAPYLGRVFSPPAFNVTQEFGTHSNLKVHHPPSSRRVSLKADKKIRVVADECIF